MPRGRFCSMPVLDRTNKDRTRQAMLRQVRSSVISHVSCESVVEAGGNCGCSRKPGNLLAWYVRYESGPSKDIHPRFSAVWDTVHPLQVSPLSQLLVQVLLKWDFLVRQTLSISQHCNVVLAASIGLEFGRLIFFSRVVSAPLVEGPFSFCTLDLIALNTLFF